jgi:hypothetical protein
MTTLAPTEGKCARCKQPRPLFPYKPEHDCIDALGRVDLIEAAQLIAEIDDQGDRWCLARIDRRPLRLCVPCHDKEHRDELAHIDQHDL